MYHCDVCAIRVIVNLLDLLHQHISTVRHEYALLYTLHSPGRVVWSIETDSSECTVLLPWSDFQSQQYRHMDALAAFTLMIPRTNSS